MEHKDIDSREVVVARILYDKAEDLYSIDIPVELPEEDEGYIADVKSVITHILYPTVYDAVEALAGYWHKYTRDGKVFWNPANALKTLHSLTGLVEITDDESDLVAKEYGER